MSVKTASSTSKVDICLVRQEDPQGCGIACAAMMCGIGYQEAKSYYAERQPDAGERPVSGYDTHQFLLSHGWEPGRHQFRGCDLSLLDDADVVYCSVMPSEDKSKAHAVLMLPDGIILDPERDSPVSSLDFYRGVHYVQAWTKLSP